MFLRMVLRRTTTCNRWKWVFSFFFVTFTLVLQLMSKWLRYVHICRKQPITCRYPTVFDGVLRAWQGAIVLTECATLHVCALYVCEALWLVYSAALWHRLFVNQIRKYFVALLWMRNSIFEKVWALDELSGFGHSYDWDEIKVPLNYLYNRKFRIEGWIWCVFFWHLWSTKRKHRNSIKFSSCNKMFTCRTHSTDKLICYL